MSKKILIIGAGPAGMFFADEALKRGYTQITIIDSGDRMSRRRCPETASCRCAPCDVLEGEGGAGGFSDGKLPYSLLRGTQLEHVFPESAESILKEIDHTVCQFAGDGVWYDPVSTVPDGFLTGPMEFQSYPLRHVGSDGVRRWSQGMMTDLTNRGVLFRSMVSATRLLIKDGALIGAYLRDRVGVMWTEMADCVVIATGIQGIPWLERQMAANGIELDDQMISPAGIGIRVETPADDLKPIFKQFYDWKVIYKHNGLTLRSFCCNQYGAIVNQWHTSAQIRNVNGHASLDPNDKTDSSNFAVVAKITSAHSPDPQAFVRAVAQDINALSGGHTVMQLASHFMVGQTTGHLPVWATNRVMARRGVDIGRAMPDDLREAFAGFINGLIERMPSMALDRSLIYAPEIKYHGRRLPINPKDWTLNGVQNAFVLGDATGRLDSFVTAALTGIIAARSDTLPRP